MPKFYQIMQTADLLSNKEQRHILIATKLFFLCVCVYIKFKVGLHN